jgi:hypothetical protein
MQEQINKKQDFERRARECLQGLHGLIEEAKREGYSLSGEFGLDVGGKPQSRIVVGLR